MNNGLISAFIQTGLQGTADIIVGNENGLGISGGQVGHLRGLHSGGHWI